MAEAARNAQPVQRCGGNGMDLGIAQHLQAVFQPPQETVGPAQVAGAVFGNMPGGSQGAQGRLQPRLAQGRLAAAADQLQHLGQELDLADPARPALDVIGQFLAGHFRGDRGLHRAQAVQRAVIQVPAVDERAQLIQESPPRGKVARYRPRLLPGIALPVAAFALEVLLHGGEAEHHPPRAAEGAQAQVHPMAEAVGGGVIQQPGQRLAELGEVLLRRQRARAVALAGAGVGIDQVDIGTEVQLLPTKLAEREHHQPHVPTRAIADPAVTGGECLLQRIMGQLQAVLGQPGTAGQGGVEVIQAKHITPHQPGGLGLAVHAQLARPVRVLTGRQRGWRKGIGAVRFKQAQGQLRLTLQRVDGEIAGDRHALQALQIDRQFQHLGAAAEGAAQAFEGAGRERLQLCGRGGVMHGAIVALGAGAAWSKEGSSPKSEAASSIYLAVS